MLWQNKLCKPQTKLGSTCGASALDCIPFEQKEI